MNRSTRVQDVIHDPAFGDCGRLIFPFDRSISDDLTLEEVRDILTWYNDINPEKEDTGLSEVTGDEPPTYCCVGTSDGIASCRAMEEQAQRIHKTTDSMLHLGFQLTSVVSRWSVYYNGGQSVN